MLGSTPDCDSESVAPAHDCAISFFNMLVCIFIDNLQISTLLYNLPPPSLPFVSMPLVPSTDPIKLLVLAPLTHTLLNMPCDFITFAHLQIS